MLPQNYLTNSSGNFSWVDSPDRLIGW